jgi:hypothetical protein
MLASWAHRNGGINFRAQHAVALGWQPELASDAGKLPAKAQRDKGTVGRLDILVDVDPERTAARDDLAHPYRGLLEVKSTNFDGVSMDRIKRTIARHRRQIVAYIGTQLDLNHPDEFAENEAFVAPGITYANTPTDPSIQAFIEGYFGEECISVVWETSAALKMVISSRR